jgi:hypothetical protein
LRTYRAREQISRLSYKHLVTEPRSKKKNASEARKPRPHLSIDFAYD